MFSAILTIMKVETSVFLNGLLYFLKKIFFLKGLLKNKSYAFPRLKNTLGIVSFLYQILAARVKGLLVPFLFIILPGLFPGPGKKDPMILLFLLYIVMKLVSSTTLEQTERKFIVVKQMRMDPGIYAHASLIKKEVFLFLGRTAALITLGQALDLTIFMAVYISFLSTLAAVTGEALHLLFFRKWRFVLEEHIIPYLILYLLPSGAAYAVFLFYRGRSLEWILMHPMLLLMLVMTSAASFFFIIRYDVYKAAIYRSTSLEKIEKAKNAMTVARTGDVMMKEKDYRLEESGEARYREKSGFALLNALFFDRHKRFFRKPVFIKTGIVFAVFALIISISLIYSKEALISFVEYISESYTVFIFIIYMLSNATKETKVMFYSCDLSMLKFGFYRQPKALLQMFTLRLVRIVINNLIPIGVMIAGILSASFLSGVHNYRDIFPVILMILALSLFFSIHYLFMYYIFQPYTSSMAVKNPFYAVINALVYIVSYAALQIDAPASGFLPVIIIFALLYAVFAVAMVYWKAPSTFRVK